MQRSFPIPILLLLALVRPLAASNHTPPPVEPATRFAAVEAHDDEKVVIAAEPYDTKEKIALFRVDYLRHGVLPIRLIVTNNGDQPLSLRDARILFQTATGERIQTAEPEDVERLISLRDRAGGTVPIPGPFPKIHRKPKASDSNVEKDFDAFEYGSIVVPPHTTCAGFLFYDVSGLAQPLKGAKLHLRMLRNANGDELFSFEIPFDKYLRSKSGQMN